MFKLTPNQIQIAVNKKGYDVFPKKQPNGNYKMEVWFFDDKCIGLGNIEYKDWHEGVKKTYEKFALKLKII